MVLVIIIEVAMAAGDVERALHTDGRPSAHLLSLDVQLVVMASEANL
jgi:hypothetical protein